MFRVPRKKSSYALIFFTFCWSCLITSGIVRSMDAGRKILMISTTIVGTVGALGGYCFAGLLEFAELELATNKNERESSMKEELRNAIENGTLELYYHKLDKNSLRPEQREFLNAGEYANPLYPKHMRIFDDASNEQHFDI